MNGPLTRLDGWMSLLKGFANQDRDALSEARHQAEPLLTLPELEQIDRTNGVGATIAERPAQDATRKWLRLESGEADLEPVLQRMRELRVGKGKRGLRLAIQKALAKARGYGGAGLVLGIRDGLPPEVPVDEGAILDLTYALPVRGDKLRPLEWESNPNSDLFGAPSLYEFISDEDGSVRRVHGSRVIRFEGVELEHHDSLSAPCQGWGDPVHQRVYRELRNVQMAEDGGIRTLLETNIPVLKIRGLAGMVGTRDGEAEVHTRMAILAACKSILRMFLIDDQESFEYKAASLAGYDKLLDIYPNRVAAVSGIPLTFLYGISPGGMNATGESDIRNYYDRVMAFIVWLHVVPAVERVATLLMKAKHGPTGGVVPQSWEVKPLPLWEQTEDEQAKTEKTHAEKDKIYIDAGVLERDEVRRSRFGQQGWRPTITLDDEARAAARAQTQGGSDLPPVDALQQGRLALDMLHTPAFAAWAAGLLGAPVPTPEEMDAYWQRKGGQAPEEGTARFDAMSRYRRSLAPLVDAAPLARMDAVEGDGARVGLFLPLPPPLAKKRPSLAPYDASPPHVTFLVVGDVRGREALFLELMQRVFGDEHLHPVRVQLGPVDSLINRSGQRVHYQNVSCDTFWMLHDLRSRLVELLRAEGFGVADVSPDCWLPHLTLAYQEDPHAPWTGAPVVGSWTVREVEVWGLRPDGPVCVPLGPETERGAA